MVVISRIRIENMDTLRSRMYGDMPAFGEKLR